MATICAVAVGLVAGPAAGVSTTAAGGSAEDSLLLEQEDVGSATPEQRAAADLAVGSALAHNPSEPGSTTYERASGLGDLAIASGAAPTEDPGAPVGISVARVLEPELPTERVDYGGAAFDHSTTADGSAEVVGSSTITEEQHIVLIRGLGAPSAYAFRLSEEHRAAGLTLRDGGRWLRRRRSGWPGRSSGG